MAKKDTKAKTSKKKTGKTMTATVIAKRMASALKSTAFWQATTAVVAVLLVASFFVGDYSNTFSKKLPDEVVAGNTIAFINQYLLQGAEAQLNSIDEVYGLIELNMTISGTKYQSYVTKDGKLLFPSVINTAVTKALADAAAKAPSQGTATGIPKSSKPTVELFVMAYCPYGTQMEKGMLPVLDTLGDKIDFQLKFVNYAMHGQKEMNEQMWQYCIEKDNPDQLTDYLYCFLKAGDREGCLTEVGLDRASLETCVNETDESFSITADYEDKSTWMGNYPHFGIHDAENVKYGVRGSPTLVVNGQAVGTARDPASLLATVCSAFNEAPEECNSSLSSATPSPGFGLDETTTASNTAACS